MNWLCEGFCVAGGMNSPCCLAHLEDVKSWVLPCPPTHLRAPPSRCQSFNSVSSLEDLTCQCTPGVQGFPRVKSAKRRMKSSLGKNEFWWGGGVSKALMAFLGLQNTVAGFKRHLILLKMNS